ncbi:MAG: hypothetical protein WBQ50_09560 [Nocardioides sp.]
MSVEQRLRKALADEAEAHDVALTALYVATRDRVHSRTVRTAASRRVPRVATVLVACAALLAVVGVGAALMGGPPARDESVSAVDGGVSTTFTCPRQRTIALDGSSDDDSFIPSLDDGAASTAGMVGAPRYRVQVEGDRAFLLLGNGDGSLASRSEFARDDGWRPVRASVCTGETSILLPGSDDADLTRREIPAFALGDPLTEGAAGVELDVRAYYDSAGLVRRQGMRVGACGKRLCIDIGVRDSYVAARVGPGATPRDLTDAFLPPDEMVGKAAPYTFTVVPDRAAALAGVTWTGTDGEVRDVEATTVPGGDGRAWFVLAPAGDLALVSVRTAAGQVTDYSPADFRG